MKLKLTGRLMAYFFAALMCLALATGTLFSYSFREYSLKLSQDALLSQAQAISKGFYQYSKGQMFAGKRGQIGAIMQLLSDASQTEAWLVDRDNRTVNMGRPQKEISYTSLPEGVPALLDQVFAGETVLSSSFSSLLGETVATVATPVFNDNGKVELALLLHSPIKGVEDSLNKSLSIMALSVLIGLLIAVPAALIAARHFVRPLKDMQIAANHMAEGDYDLRLPAARRDELGALERDLNLLSQTLKTAKAADEKAEDGRRVFMASLSHELRTPVTVLRSSLEALNDQVVIEPAQVADYHLSMLGETKRLERLIGDLSTLSRLDHPGFQVQKEPCSALSLLENTKHAAQALSAPHGLQILMQLPADFVLTGDAQRLKQALLALVDNAVRFSPKGGTITIGGEQNETLRSSVLYVQDEGEGISPESLPFLFDRFYTTSLRETGGAGLGLAIVQEIAHRHGGKAVAMNRAEGGARFELRLPL